MGHVRPVWTGANWTRVWKLTVHVPVRANGGKELLEKLGATLRDVEETSRLMTEKNSPPLTGSQSMEAGDNVVSLVI